MSGSVGLIWFMYELRRIFRVVMSGCMRPMYIHCPPIAHRSRHSSFHTHCTYSSETCIIRLSSSRRS